MTETPDPTPRRRVVIAEDEALIRMDLAEMLAEEGYDVVAAVEDGEQAVSSTEELRPDLVILDMQIGNLGGIATCLDLRLEEGKGRLPVTPILMLLDRDADLFLAKRSQADGWLFKPIDAFRLRKASQALLAGGEYKEQPRTPVGS